MPETQRVGSLEIAQDLDFQRREWVVQRVGWWIGVAILLAGAAGLLGAGPLSHASASSGPLEVDYDRFVRRRAPSQFDVVVGPGAAVEGEVSLWIDGALLEKIDVERIMPEPSAMEASPGRVVYRFVVEDPEQPVRITFHLEPDEPGGVRGGIGMVDGAEVTIDQFIFP